jgi:hypothetical protein
MEKKSAVLEKGEGSLSTPRADRRKEMPQGLEQQVSDLFGKLNLTAKEKNTLVLEDAEDSDLAVVNHVVIGKVLAPNPMQLQTIMSAMRPAWGNPRGLEARMVGDNLFIAEFESEFDKSRVLEGSPWYIGRQAVDRQTVILQDFNSDMRPTDFSFNEMAIWVNILNLPLGLRNEKWGFEIAGKIGKEVLKVDVDEQKRAVGKELRARVVIPLNEPLPRGVYVFSSRRQRKEWYDVVYERLPYFCFSCGIIGHSEIECPTPAMRDDKGCLPCSEKLRAPKDRRLKYQSEWHGQGDTSPRKSNSSGMWGGSGRKKMISEKSNDHNKVCNREDEDQDGNGVSSPDWDQESDTSRQDLVAYDKEIISLTKKRKSDKRMEGQGRNIMEVENLSLALMPHTQSGGDLQEKRGTKEVIDGSKKMKKENAGLPEQLRAQK